VAGLPADGVAPHAGRGPADVTVPGYNGELE
jgi:hypothetical protein